MTSIFQQHQDHFDTANDIETLQKVAEFTIRPIPIYNFTDHYVPMKVPGMGIGEGIGGVISEATDVGFKIIDKGTDLVTTVVDTGLNILSEQIKIIVIIGSIIGEIIFIFIFIKYRKQILPNQNKNKDLTKLQNYANPEPPIWKGMTKPKPIYNYH